MSRPDPLYIFEKSGSGWTQIAKLLASDGAAHDEFGCSVSISGDTAVVGAVYGSDSGSAYVFENSGSGWIQTAKLLATDGAGYDTFGYSVSISGDRAVIGSFYDDDKGHDSGSAYIFEKTGSGWAQTAKLLATDGAATESFGFSVSLSGDRAVVGAVLDDDNGFHSGSAYIFETSGPNDAVLVFRELDGDKGSFWGELGEVLEGGVPGWNHVGLFLGQGPVYESHRGYDAGAYVDPITGSPVPVAQDSGVQWQHTLGSFEHSSKDTGPTEPYNERIKIPLTWTAPLSFKDAT